MDMNSLLGNARLCCAQFVLNCPVGLRVTWPKKIVGTLLNYKRDPMSTVKGPYNTPNIDSSNIQVRSIPPIVMAP